MGWETRENGGRYYTRSKWRDGRVVREYVGTGKLAELWAELDEFEREGRRLDAESERVQMAEYDDLEQQLATICEVADVFAQLALLDAGYHQHKRGEWRKRRVKEGIDQESTGGR